MLRQLLHRLRRGSLVAAGLTLVAVSPSRASAQFSNLFFFGDSFTDYGNVTGLAALNGFPNPTPSPYSAGRFSNGPIWAERFAAQLGLPTAAGPAWLQSGNNYAVGGATTDSTGIFGTPTGMQNQAKLFAAQHQQGVAPGALYVLWGGGNDLTNTVASSLTGAQQTAAMQAAAQNIIDIASGLYKFFGARNFLVPFLPDGGAAPLYANDPAEKNSASALTDDFNSALAVGLAGLSAAPGVNAFGLHLDVLLDNVLFDARSGGSRYGITNTTTPCFLLLPLNPQACDTALFVDDRHPTAAFGALIADAAYDRVVNGRDVQAVPEPTTVLLVAAGLSFVGLAARRRQRA